MVSGCALNGEYPPDLGEIELFRAAISTEKKDISRGQVSQAALTAAAHFDDPLGSSRSGVSLRKKGLRSLAHGWWMVRTDTVANAGPKVESLVADEVALADSISDMALLRSGGMERIR
jgi:hypothetical protein